MSRRHAREAIDRDDAAFAEGIRRSLAEQRDASVSKLGTPAHPGCVGLTNEGFTCYQNCVFQVLFRWNELHDALRPLWMRTPESTWRLLLLPLLLYCFDCCCCCCYCCCCAAAAALLLLLRCCC